jgi:hypothetical protein
MGLALGLGLVFVLVYLQSLDLKIGVVKKTYDFIN